MDELIPVLEETNRLLAEHLSHNLSLREVLKMTPKSVPLYAIFISAC